MSPAAVDIAGAVSVQPCGAARMPPHDQKQRKSFRAAYPVKFTLLWELSQALKKLVLALVTS